MSNITFTDMMPRVPLNISPDLENTQPQEPAMLYPSNVAPSQSAAPAIPRANTGTPETNDTTQDDINNPNNNESSAYYSLSCSELLTSLKWILAVSMPLIVVLAERHFSNHFLGESTTLAALTLGGCTGMMIVIFAAVVRSKMVLHNPIKAAKRGSLLPAVQRICSKDMSYIARILEELLTQNQKLLVTQEAFSHELNKAHMTQHETVLELVKELNDLSESSSLGTIDSVALQFDLLDGDDISTKLSEFIETRSASRTQYEGFASQIVEGIETLLEMTSQVKNLANKSRLLSFNATIESKRSGSDGAGFGAIAKEVKVLANQTGAIAQQIDQSVMLAVYGVEEMKSIMLDEYCMDQENIELQKCVKKFAELSHSVTTLSQHNTNIIDTAATQTTAIERISSATTAMLNAQKHNRKSLVRLNTQRNEVAGDFSALLKNIEYTENSPVLTTVSSSSTGLRSASAPAPLYVVAA